MRLQILKRYTTWIKPFITSHLDFITLTISRHSGLKTYRLSSQYIGSFKTSIDFIKALAPLLSYGRPHFLKFFMMIAFLLRPKNSLSWELKRDWTNWKVIWKFRKEDRRRYKQSGRQYGHTGGTREWLGVERWQLCLQDTSRSAKCHRRAAVGHCFIVCAVL